MPEPSNREVKAESEVIDADNIPDEGDEGDDDVISAEEIPDEQTPDEQTPESSPEEMEGSEEEIPEESSKVPLKKEPAPVAGETPKEKALRIEIQELREEKRKNSIAKLTGQDGPVKESSYDELKKMGYSEEEIANMDKAIEIIASNRGFVKAKDSYQDTVNQVVDGFLDENPEFKPENDPADVRWQEFQKILQEGTYNVMGKSSKQLKEIFKKVKRDVDDKLGEATVATDTKKVAAQRQKIKSVSHSGGTKSTAKEKSQLDPSVRSMFKGFDDEDLQG